MTKGWYGVGRIKGLDIGQAVNANRSKHVQGKFLIDGVTLIAASGSSTRWGCPYGTYILTPQPTGSAILKLYKRLKIQAYPTVWNVGRPGFIASTGFDPGPGRGRRAIQIHCDYLMKSQGCIVMDEDNFQAFAHLAAGKKDMVLEVAPDKGGVEFRVLDGEAIGA